MTTTAEGQLITIIWTREEEGIAVQGIAVQGIMMHELTGELTVVATEVLKANHTQMLDQVLTGNMLVKMNLQDLEDPMW